VKIRKDTIKSKNTSGTNKKRQTTQTQAKARKFMVGISSYCRTTQKVEKTIVCQSFTEHAISGSRYQISHPRTSV
jgi:hypothetical protein